MQKMRFPAVISTFIVCFAFWVLLTWSFEIQELAAGAVVSLAVALFAGRFFVHAKSFWFFNPVKLVNLIIYVLFIFPVELIKANWDVAKRCFGGCKNVNPGIVKVPVDLQSDYGQAMLANSITLTPGTITAVQEGDKLTVHCLDAALAEGVEDQSFQRKLLGLEKTAEAGEKKEAQK